jgi:hypothetical protein
MNFEAEIEVKISELINVTLQSADRNSKKSTEYTLSPEQPLAAVRFFIKGQLSRIHRKHNPWNLAMAHGC